MFTSRNLVAFALFAIACTVFLSSGCTRDEEVREPAQPSAEEPVKQLARMEDPAYREALDKRRDARKELLGVRQRLVSQMEAKIAAAKERLGTEDEAVLKVELEKDPEWNSLYERVEDLNTALEDERKRTSALVRDRIKADMQKESAAR